MNKEEFFALSYMEIGRITGKRRQRFSEYNAGKPMGERALIKNSEKFGVSPGTLLDWIIEWREFDVFDPDAPYVRKYQETENVNFFVGDDNRFGLSGNPVMSEEVFLGLSVEDMQEMLTMPSNRMNCFLTGTMMDEKTIRMLASIFKITPGTFLDWFMKWKEKNSRVSASAK